MIPKKENDKLQQQHPPPPTTHTHTHFDNSQNFQILTLVDDLPWNRKLTQKQEALQTKLIRLPYRATRMRAKERKGRVVGKRKKEKAITALGSMSPRRMLSLRPLATFRGRKTFGVMYGGLLASKAHFNCNLEHIISNYHFIISKYLFMAY